MDLVVAITLVGGAGLLLGFCLGYGARSHVSARRHRRWRYRHEELPLHQAPLLAPDDARYSDKLTKPVDSASQHGGGSHARH